MFPAEFGVVDLRLVNIDRWFAIEPILFVGQSQPRSFHPLVSEKAGIARCGLSQVGTLLGVFPEDIGLLHGSLSDRSTQERKLKFHIGGALARRTRPASAILTVREAEQLFMKIKFQWRGLSQDSFGNFPIRYPLVGHRRLGM